MKKIETYYLIDYENVGCDGLSGCNSLNKTDHIIIFFTKNAKKIDMSEIANHGNAELDMIEVPAGKQSADIHIGSYFGYLAGMNKENNYNIVIISKDNDFDNVIKFWKEKAGIRSSRVQQIKLSAPKNAAVKDTTSANKSTVKVCGAEKSKLNREIMQAVRAAGFDASVGNSVAQLVVRLYGEDRFLSKVHNALSEKYTNHLKIYRSIKSVLSKYSVSMASSPVKTTVSNASVINANIVQILSSGGFDPEIVHYVASVAVKNVGKKNRKQQIYSAIISKYGQKKGLNIYNHIKKHI